MALQHAKDALSPEFFSLSCESMLLDVKTQWMMQCVSKSFSLGMVKSRSMWAAYVDNISRRHLPALTWIRTTDAGLEDFVPAVYVYHADMLMRSFMFNVLRSEVSPVLAGSVGTALLMNKICAVRSWIPRDVDFFVASEFQMEQIANAYIENVLNPLACEFQKDVFPFYADPGNEGGNDSDSEEEFEISNAARGEFLSWDEMLNIASAYTVLRSLVRGSNCEMNGAGYRAVAGAVVQPLWPDGASRELRSLILPLNVTFVKLSGGCQRFQPQSFPLRVRRGFDLLPCAVSVKLRSDLSFLCSYSQSTLEGLRNSALEINVEEVSRRRSRDLKRIVRRILKYLRRGFTFVHASSRTTARSIEEVSADVLEM